MPFKINQHHFAKENLSKYRCFFPLMICFFNLRWYHVTCYFQYLPQNMQYFSVLITNSGYSSFHVYCTSSSAHCVKMVVVENHKMLELRALEGHFLQFYKFGPCRALQLRPQEMGLWFVLQL